MTFAKAIYLGESNASLKKGMTYTIRAVKKRNGQPSQYALEEADGVYSSNLFRVTKNRKTTYIAILEAPHPPIEGECIQNLKRLNENGEWEIVNTDIAEMVCLMNCNGNVYGVHTHNETYLISYFKTV